MAISDIASVKLNTINTIVHDAHYTSNELLFSEEQVEELKRYVKECIIEALK